MKVIALAISIMALVGCAAKPKPMATDGGQTVAQAVASVVSHQEPAYIKQLRGEAGRLGLDWNIVCNGDSYDANAWNPGNPVGKQWADDGVKPYWYVQADSQRAAANLLYHAIQSEPNFKPRHKPKDKAHQCLPPLQGGPGIPEKYADDRCTDCSAD